MTPNREEKKADQPVTTGPKQQHGGEFPISLCGFICQGWRKCQPQKANGTRQRMPQQLSAPSGQRTRSNLACRKLSDNNHSIPTKRQGKNCTPPNP